MGKLEETKEAYSVCQIDYLLTSARLSSNSAPSRKPMMRRSASAKPFSFRLRSASRQSRAVSLQAHLVGARFRGGLASCLLASAVVAFLLVPPPRRCAARNHQS